MTSTPEDMGLAGLTLKERLDLIAILWDSIAESPEHVPIPDWHREELDRRLGGGNVNPAAGISWDELKKRLQGQA